MNKHAEVIIGWVAVALMVCAVAHCEYKKVEAVEKTRQVLCDKPETNCSYVR